MLKLDIKDRLSGIISQTKELPPEKKENDLLHEALFQAIRFMISFLLSRAIIFSEYAPFGVAFTAALAGIDGSVAAFSGAFLGYTLLWGRVDGLKYAACCVLCFSAGAIFRQTKAMAYKFFMPLAAAVSLASVGFVFIAEDGASLSDILLFFSELLLVAGSTWFYRDVFLKAGEEEKSSLWKRERAAGLMVLTVTLLSSLCGTTIFGIISPARILSLLLILSGAYFGGAGTGTALAVASGAVMDATVGNGIFFTAIYGICALISGAAREKNKLLFTMLYVLTNAAVSMWSLSNPLYLAGLYETFIASVLFYIIPMQVLVRAKALFMLDSNARTPDAGEKIKKYAGHRLNLAASAFQELYVSMSLGIDNLRHRNDEDIAAVFDRAADKVCQKCAARHICWERDYVTTVGALNDASNDIMKRGRAEKSDFPSYFASKCMYFEPFVAALNEAVSALMQRRQYKLKLQENKNLIREQYAAVNDILRSVARDVETGLEFHPNYSRQLKEYVKTFCPDASITVTSGKSGRMCIEIDGENLMPILEERSRFNKGVSMILARSFDAPEQIMTKSKMSVRLVEAERFRASIGAGVRRRRGETVSGDSGTYFKTEEGMLYLTLSDGMGSGRDAALESAVAVKLVERFLRAGISARKTARTITPALALKNGEDGYATIDILGVDLFSGKSVSVKYGAAPTYLKNGQKVESIVSKVLPLSASPERIPEPQLTDFTLGDGSIAVMISDGVTEAFGDGWLIELLKDFEGDDVKKLAGDILGKASQKGEETDDMTVLVLKLKKR